MAEKVRAMLRGVGSLLNIYPGPQRYEDLLLTGSAEDRLAEHWQRVGGHLRNAMDGYRDAEIGHRKQTRARKESPTAH